MFFKEISVFNLFTLQFIKSNKGNWGHNVLISDLLIKIAFSNFISPFSPSLNYPKLKSVFEHTSKHLEAHQKYSSSCGSFNSLKCCQTQSFVQFSKKSV